MTIYLIIVNSKIDHFYNFYLVIEFKNTQTFRQTIHQHARTNSEDNNDLKIRNKYILIINHKERAFLVGSCYEKISIIYF